MTFLLLLLLGEGSDGARAGARARAATDAGDGVAGAETDETPRKSREHTAAGSKNRDILLLIPFIRAKLLFRDTILLAWLLPYLLRLYQQLP
jgi:hypothetical protein